MIENQNLTIDLNGYTFEVSEGADTSSRAFKIIGTSVVTVKNGTIIAAADINSGAYGTIRTEGTAVVTLENLKLYNYRGGGLNVKVVTGTTVTLNSCEIYSQYGGGVEASGGTIVLNNTKIEQKGVYSNGWYSVAIEINGGGKVTVNSGEYFGSAIDTDDNAKMGNSIAFILSSGGTLDIKGGTFSGVVAEEANASNFCGLIYADARAIVNIYGGTFNSNGAILDMRNNEGNPLANPEATLYGGTFSADPTVSGLYAGNLIKLAEGKKVVEQDGTYTVDTIIVAKVGDQYFSNLADAIEAAKNGETVTLLDNVVLPDNWTPACNGTRSGSSYTGEAFAGVLDGNGYTISNVKDSLIGVLVGTVKNVTIEANINNATSDSVGAVAGILVGGTISKVTVSGTVVGPKAVGGIVGRVLADGNIDNCVNTAAVTSTSSSDAAGGIVGKAYYTATGKEMNITNCTNSGTISGKYAAGGIVGFSAANVIGCTNRGDVVLAGNTAKSIGGIIGEQTNYGEVAQNANFVNITVTEGTANAGGIIGWLRYQNSAANYPANETVIVNGNTNEGAIASTYTAGGIIGLAYNQAIVTENENKATSVSAGTFAGGIVGGLQVDNNNLSTNEAIRFTVTQNTTATALENITANCKDAIAYNNGPGDPTFAKISDNILK